MTRIGLRGSPNEVYIIGDAAEVVLTGRFGVEAARVVIDLTDLPLVSGRRWSRHGGYAMTKYGGQAGVLLHRLLMGIIDRPDVYVDHIDGNGLNCRRSNMRLATHAENLQNMVRTKRRDTGEYRPPDMRGVSWFKPAGMWRVRLRIDGKETHLGYFRDVEEAKKVARESRAKHFPFANEDRHR